MKNLKRILLPLLFSAVIFSCNKSNPDDSPYITFRDADDNVINSSIPISAKLNSTIRVFSEAGYNTSDNNRLHYEWKIGNEDFKQYTMYDGLNIYSIGSFNNLSVQKATLDITFSEEKMQSGSIVIVRIHDSFSLWNLLTFIIN